MLRWFLALTVAAVSLSTASAAFNVSAIPSVGPIQTGPGYNTYLANAIQGLHNGGSFGAPGTTSYYTPAGSYTNGGSINNIDQLNGGVTGLFRGVINDPAYTGSLGNALYMGLALTSTAGSTIAPNGVTYNGYNYSGNPPPPFVSTTAPFSLASVLSNGNVYGATTSGGPITQLTAANAATPYAELYYVGPAYSVTDFFGSDWTNPATLAALFPDPATPRGFLSGSYAACGVTGVGGTDINGVPAPATFVLMGLGFVGSSVVARVRRRRVVA